jgi:hypothetical protein
MNAVAVPGTEGDCCQKYICGMYTHRWYLSVPRQVLWVHEALWFRQLQILVFSQFESCKCTVKISLLHTSRDLTFSI